MLFQIENIKYSYELEVGRRVLHLIFKLKKNDFLVVQIINLFQRHHILSKKFNNFRSESIEFDVFFFGSVIRNKCLNSLDY